LRLDGRLLCWGDDEFRQISGKNAVIASGQLRYPIQSVSTGSRHTCAIGSEKSFACWGSNEDGKVDGYNDPSNRSAELKFPVLSVSAGAVHICAIGAEYSFACWGKRCLWIVQRVLASW
jgi:alpha-tubulin suppressor-like RCC1 family protein